MKRKHTAKYSTKRRYQKNKNIETYIMLGMAFIAICVANDKLIIGIVILMAALLLPILKKKLHEWRIRKKYEHSPISKIDKMSGEEFEIYLQAQFLSLGYHVEHIGQSGDYGADLILKKDNVTTIVQAKRYNNPVGIKAVQEVISAKEFYHGDEMMVVTNSTFTPAAKTLAAECGVKLWDRSVCAKVFNTP